MIERSYDLHLLNTIKGENAFILIFLTSELSGIANTHLRSITYPLMILRITDPYFLIRAIHSKRRSLAPQLIKASTTRIWIAPIQLDRPDAETRPVSIRVGTAARTRNAAKVENFSLSPHLSAMAEPTAGAHLKVPNLLSLAWSWSHDQATRDSRGDLGG